MTNSTRVVPANAGTHTPAVINAIVDALREFGVRDVPMPATSERIWTAIQGGRRE